MDKNNPKSLNMSFHLSAEAIELLSRLRVRLGGLNRSSVIRLALQRLAEQELPATSKKSGK